MKLWQAIIIRATNDLTGESFIKVDVEALFEKECYKVLEKIKSALEDTDTDDRDCFEKIENIILFFERMGVECGKRHDF